MRIGRNGRFGLMSALALAAVVGAASVQAQTGTEGARPASGYLAAGQTPDSLVIVPPPPEPGSPLDQADRAYFNATRSLEGSARWAQAQADVPLFGAVAHRSFGCAVGKSITPQTTPTLSRLMDRLVIDAGTSTSPSKARYNRVRPPVGNDQPICVKREDWLTTNGSFPSGHAAVGWIWGLVLAELAPDKATAAVTRGREFGESRAICGVHFPTDVEAGRLMGTAVYARLQAEPAFRADMQTAREELAKAPAAEGCGTP